MNALQEKYLAEVEHRLRRAGFEAGPEYNGLLPIKKDAHQLCTINMHGGMSYDPDFVRKNGQEDVLDQARHIAVETLTYMRQMASAPLLTADGLSGDYRVLAEFDNVVLAASIFLFYAGMEMSGVHVRQIKNPAVNYPKAVFGGALVTVLIFVLGTYALGVIIPAKDINLVQSLLVGFDNYLVSFHLDWLTPVIAIALAFGVLAGVLTWVAGPSKGVFAVGQAGYLPPFFQKTNKAGVQKNILIVQGLAVTLLSLLFVVMPSVQSFYQILSQLTVLLYLIAYLLMFAAAIYLRYSMKEAKRPFRIGSKGNWLMWVVGGVGFLGSLLAFVLSFLPPDQISMGSTTVWYAVLFGGVIIFTVLPFIILAFRKPSWVNPKSDFVPFHWQKDPESQALLKAAQQEYEAKEAQKGQASAADNG